MLLVEYYGQLALGEVVDMLKALATEGFAAVLNGADCKTEVVFWVFVRFRALVTG